MKRAFFWVFGAYLLAGLAAFLAGLVFDSRHPIAIAAMADVTATLVVFGFSYRLSNSSIYDPYWSVAPVLIAFYWAFYARASEADIARFVLVLALVCLWAFRLTFNWAQRWRGLADEDWRYAGFRRRNKMARYWAISFFGFHLMPTVVVFLGCLSLFPVFAHGGGGFGGLDILAVLITGGAIYIEARSDMELRHHRLSHGEGGTTISTGIWAWTRHPNYFGEITFWWGLYLFGLAAEPDYWWSVAGPVCITLMFVFISIPMMEKRLIERHAGYTDYTRRTSVLVPWLPRKGR